MNANDTPTEPVEAVDDEACLVGRPVKKLYEAPTIEEVADGAPDFWCD